MRAENKELQWDNIEDNDIREVFDILTGNTYFTNRPFSNDETQPDLIIKWRLSEQRYISRTQFEDVGRYISVPPYCLEKAFELAEKKIIHTMNAEKENRDNKEVQLRFIKNLVEMQQGKQRFTKVQYDTGGDQEIKLMCYDEKTPEIDGFTLNFHSVIYMLQRVCGFKVRTFMVHTQEENKEGIMAIAGKVGLGILSKKPVRDIYIFLNLSIENMLKVAGRFQIKKELDYSVIDFFLNDPSSEDNRPLKYHSKIKVDTSRTRQVKWLSRYFQIRDSFDINSDILDEKDLSLLDEQKFQSYWQEINLILEFFQNRIGSEVSNQEKIYLYHYNRGKLNVGCQKVLALIKKRREFFELMKDVCQKYQYNYHDEPVFHQEFILPHKNSKGGFFQKLKNMLVYKFMEVSPYGDLGLFLSMQKTKLCYLMIKSTFKVNYLQRMGIDILALNNDFEKLGQGGQKQMVRGGLNGTFLTDRWYPFALFSDIKLLRNYFGDVLAHEIMLRISIIAYLLIISVPYAVLYIFEILYTNKVYLYSTMIEAGLFAITFSMYMLLVQEMENQYSRTYSDKRHSKVFINQYRGPYLRNILTDELNQFEEEGGIWIFIKNFICLIIFGMLIAMFGGVFYASRSLLIAIQPGLYRFESNYISLAHILSYSIYFVVGDLFKMKFYDKVVSVMLWIKNPSSDQSQRNLRSYFTFYYLLSLEIVPIGFFFVIEPFSGTSCYSSSCDLEFYNYIYARFLFNIAMAAIGFINAVIFNWAKKKLLNVLEDEKKSNTFPERLGRMLKNAVDESLREHYDDGLTKDILNLFAYSFYCSELAISGLIALATITTVYFVARLSLIHEYRRPINKSQPIILFSRYCRVIYFIGLLINIAINTFLLLYIEKYYIFIINLAPKPLTSSTIFMIKIAFSALFFIVVSILGIIGRSIGIAFSPKALMIRQTNKYKQYSMMVSGPKTSVNKPSTARPTKSVFRTFNPDKMNHERLLQMLNSQQIQAISNHSELRDPNLSASNRELLKGSQLKRSNSKI